MRHARASRVATGAVPLTDEAARTGAWVRLEAEPARRTRRVSAMRNEPTPGHGEVECAGRVTPGLNTLPEATLAATAASLERTVASTARTIRAMVLHYRRPRISALQVDPRRY
jgi:hypothetical protein